MVTNHTPTAWKAVLAKYKEEFNRLPTIEEAYKEGWKDSGAWVDYIDKLAREDN